MSNSYTYDPRAWHPVIAGAVAGALAAIVAGLVSLPLREPDEALANTLTVVLVSLALGVVSGALWRRLRATNNAQRVFAWSMFGGFLAAMVAVSIIDQTLVAALIPYATPLAVIIFITLGFFTPMFSRVTAPLWSAAVPILIALALGAGLFNR